MTDRPTPRMKERFHQEIRSRAKARAAGRNAQSRPFEASMLDGLDLRETVRNAWRKELWVMEHPAKDGSSKILRKCTRPRTARQEVDMVITNLAVFIRDEKGLVLVETAPGVTVDEIKAATEADYAVSPDLKIMDVA